MIAVLKAAFWPCVNNKDNSNSNKYSNLEKNANE